MRNLHLRWSLALAVVVIVVGGSVAFAAFRDNFDRPAAPVAKSGTVAQLTLTGRNSGHIPGSGINGTIRVVGLDFILKRASFDAQTQLPAGKDLCRGVSFRKPTDASTPILFAAESTNEVMTQAVFRENGFAIRLTDAVVASVHHLATADTGQYEDVVLAPSTIEFEWSAGGITANHDCTTGPG
jgi:type VI protein secretion system component Hcp